MIGCKYKGSLFPPCQPRKGNSKSMQNSYYRQLSMVYDTISKTKLGSYETKQQRFTLMEMLIVIAINRHIDCNCDSGICITARKKQGGRRPCKCTICLCVGIHRGTTRKSSVHCDGRSAAETGRLATIDPINIGGIVHSKNKVIRTTGKALPRQTEPVSCRIAKTMESFLLGAEQLIRPRRNTV